MMHRSPLKDRARGRWKSILPMLGLADMKVLSGKHGPCPFCGGKDRFRFDDKDGTGTFICSQCGAGDGVEFVRRKTGMDFRQVAERIESVIGVAPRIQIAARQTEDQQREALNRLWGKSAAIRSGDPVSCFHRKRHISLDIYPASLRYCDRLAYREDDGSSSFHPAMVAMVSAPDGRPATLHRTYLAEGGSKAPVAHPRRLMPGIMPKGSAVRLAAASDVLGVAEGIETAFAASILFGLPVWAAINAGNMEAWRPPDGVKQVLIFGDHDASYRGQAAAYALASKIQGPTVSAEVHIPPAGDWNDQLITEVMAQI